jgi:hypothetical protein
MAADHVDFKLYRYNPSMAAAVIFIILFLLVTVLHTYQMLRTRTWIFIPFVIGGVCKIPTTIVPLPPPSPPPRPTSTSDIS